MRVLITRQVMISGEPAQAGSSLDLPDAVAMLLITSGKATPAPEAEPAPEPKPEPKPAASPAKASAKPKPPAPPED